jgi:hypothetical protein
MDSKKITLIVLVLIALLFVVGQGAGLFRDDKSDEDPSPERQQEISQKQSGWIGAIKGGLGWLNLLDRIELRRFSDWSVSPSEDTHCSVQRADGGIRLTMGAKCKLSATIAEADDEQELKLKVEEGCGQSREFVRMKRISSVIAAKPQRVPGRIPARPSGEAPAESDEEHWPKLSISFKPKPENEKEVTMDNPWACGDKPVTLIILPEGGTLSLECGSCTNERALVIAID